MKRTIRTEKGRRHRARKQRVAKRVRRGIRPELCVFRSSKHIYAQLVEPGSGRTLTTVSSRSRSVMGDRAGSASGNVDAARRVGAAIAAAARERNIEEVVFNRNGFLYHGRVKALAEAAREAGLRF